jgi:uncharacterized protein (TIGR02145 family)
MNNAHYQLQLDNILDQAEPFVPKYSEDELREMGNTLQETLNSYRIPCTVKNGKCGTMITRFEIKIDIAKGAKIDQITSRLEEIALSLEVSSAQCRREDGKLFLEIPNGKVQKITIREMLEGADYDPEKGRLPIALGKKVSGETVLLDIAKAPHILIAGGTGSGKSVCLNAMIINLLLTKSPNELRMILIDPKQVEFNDYANIPHLLHSIINNTDTLVLEAIEALEWAKLEMNRRGKLFTNNTKTCKGIGEYNELQVKEGKKPLPYILIIIDEYADLIHSAESIGKETKNKLEGFIKTLAAKARYAGIHLVIATQRPAADIITKEIKDNIGKRICFKVADSVSSRLVISETGAETLQGNGDFLMHDNDKLVHAQGMFVSDDEIFKIVDLWSKDQFKFTRLQSFKEHSFFSDSPKKEVSVDVTSQNHCEDTPISSIQNPAPEKEPKQESINPKESTEQLELDDVVLPVTSETADSTEESIQNESKDISSISKSNLNEPIQKDVRPESTYAVNTKVAPIASARVILKKEPPKDSGYVSIATKPIPKIASRPKKTTNPQDEDDLYLEDDSILSAPVSKYYTDPRDGETYRVVKIGKQIWMAENFRFASRDSLSINENDENDNPYGRLYTWEEATQVAPEGWRLPSIEDWQRLNKYIPRYSKIQTGTALKCKDGWKKGFTTPEGKDIYGFSALATGFWNRIKKDFCNITFSTNLWTSIKTDSDHAYSVLLHYLNEGIKAEASHILNGLPIRLIKDS